LGISDGNSESNWKNIYLETNALNDFSNFASGSPCDSCWPDRDFARTQSDGKWITEIGLDLFTTVCVRLDRCADEGYAITNRQCYDVDECAEQLHDCQANQVCTNTDGSYECACDSGYEEDESGNCVDIDECTEPNDGFLSCVDFGTCVNNDGSFICNGEFECSDRVFRFNWSNKRNFHDAKEHCESLGMKLPNPISQTEQDCFTTMAALGQTTQAEFEKFRLFF